MSTRVFLTIDTEFTIGGAFSQPDRRRPVGARSVRCPTREGAAGLGFVLDTFEDHGLKATFFIETLQTAWFGDGPMGEIAAEIAARGHDTQLHLHPVWTWFDAPAWRARLADARPNDDAHGRSPAELIAWIRRGKAAFARWGLPAGCRSPRTWGADCSSPMSPRCGSMPASTASAPCWSCRC
jgi:hypothetical protein